MRKLREIVKFLVKGQAGSGSTLAENRNRVLELEAFGRAQTHRGWLLTGVLAVLLAAPLVLTQMSVPKEILGIFVGASSIFAAGTVKMVLSAFQDVSRAHTLAVICTGLDSVDAREVMTAWLKSK